MENNLPRPARPGEIIYYYDPDAGQLPAKVMANYPDNTVDLELIGAPNVAKNRIGYNPDGLILTWRFPPHPKAGYDPTGKK